MSSLFDLTGKSAIITGSSRGIGKAIAHRMAQHGAKVVITSRKLDACEKVSAEINNEFGSDASIAIACNISDKDQLKNLFPEHQPTQELEIEESPSIWLQKEPLICKYEKRLSYEF